MFERVSAGECKGKWRNCSCRLRLRINFGAFFLLDDFPLLALRSGGSWADLPTKQFYLLTRKAGGWVGEWAKPAKLVRAVEGEGGAD